MGTPSRTARRSRRPSRGSRVGPSRSGRRTIFAARSRARGSPTTSSGTAEMGLGPSFRTVSTTSSSTPRTCLTETPVVGGVSWTTTFTYDLAGHLETKEDPRQHLTRSVYDGNGRITEVHDPLGNVRRTSFFPAGELRSETDEAGQTTTYAYRDVNGQGLLVEIFRPDGTIVFRQEDKAGNLILEEI